jgi:hypothetical protein
MEPMKEIKEQDDITCLFRGEINEELRFIINALKVNTTLNEFTLYVTNINYKYIKKLLQIKNSTTGIRIFVDNLYEIDRELLLSMLENNQTVISFCIATYTIYKNKDIEKIISEYTDRNRYNRLLKSKRLVDL